MVSGCGWRFGSLEGNLNQTAVEAWPSRVSAIIPARGSGFERIKNPVEVGEVDYASIERASKATRIFAIERVAFQHSGELVLTHMGWFRGVGMNEAPA